jgi:hypothetical protein
MNQSRANSDIHDVTGQAGGAVTWISEFERMFVRPARIRAEKTGRVSGSQQASGSPARRPIR